jgi:hypothetical protein
VYKRVRIGAKARAMSCEMTVPDINMTNELKNFVLKVLPLNRNFIANKDTRIPVFF